MNRHRPRFVVVIATRNRTGLLSQRALASVAGQRRKPDLVILADDSDCALRPGNAKAAAKFESQSGIQTIYLPNQRNKGACGAWNTCASQALVHSPRPDNTYLAILDDDDAWTEDHLTQAEAALGKDQDKDHWADVLASGFDRRDGELSNHCQPPQSMDRRSFLVGNPGVRGSTLFIRLTTFLRAGMFDESLQACTDRDLCLRLFLLPQVKYQPLPAITVIHHNDAETRLSTAYSPPRLQGLSQFADKYRGWMTDAEYRAHCQRAERLFGWAPDATRPTIPQAAKPPQTPPQSDEAGDLALIIGVIVDPNQQDNPLFADMLELAQDQRLASVAVMVVPESNRHRRKMSAEIQRWRAKGLRLYCADKPATKFQQLLRTDRCRDRRPIAVNRSILQHAISRLAKRYANPVCWILDGDSRLQSLQADGCGHTETRPDYVGEILRLRATGCDAAIGPITGAAPLPRALTVRTQLLDLLHLWVRLRQSDSDRHPPQTTIANTSSTGPGATLSPHYYHDCGKHRHAEQPVGMSPLPADRTLRDLLQNLPDFCNRILAGDAVTRPLLQDADRQTAIPAGHRGGNTLVFDPAMLSECPNLLSPNHAPHIRRQDELWRIVNESVLGRTFAAGNFPVRQCRRLEQPQAPDIDRLGEDIAGHAIATAVRQFASSGEYQTIDALCKALLAAGNDFHQRVKQAAESRLLELRLSFFRITGIAASMQGLLAESGCKRDEQALAPLLRHIEQRFADRQTARVAALTEPYLERGRIRKILADFERFSKDFNTIEKVWTPCIDRDRLANARALLRRQLPQTPARLLGQGGEGAVFADGKLRFKVLHPWWGQLHNRNPDLLYALSGQFKKPPLYPILAAKKEQGDLLLITPYERTKPYLGGYGSGLVEFLATLKQERLVYDDLSLPNLRRAGRSIRLIDYGRDLAPFSERGFDLSARKAWLCWRWGFREDLRTLLTATLGTAELPELDGYETLKQAVAQYAVEARPADTAIAELLSESPASVLDCGCGKGKDALTLTAHGITTVAYDPALTQATRVQLQKAGVEVLDHLPTASGVYQAVLLRHVICEIVSNSELRQCLSRLRHLLREDGHLVVTGCDPNHLAHNTPGAESLLPKNVSQGQKLGQKFRYQKRIRKTGRRRQHVHRPEHLINREFSRAGFQIVERKATADIDLDRMQPGGGVLQWRLQPMPKRPSVTLIIRACAMDAAYAERQVQHLVRQLNYPRGFAEIMLAIDNRKDDFLRPHTEGDLPALKEAAKRLQHQGWIDRIILCPDKEQKIRQLNRKWLGMDTAITHASNGAPLTVVFAAFEQCRTSHALHLDIDMIVGRTDPGHDYLSLMLQAIQTPRALTVACNIPNSENHLKQQQSPSYGVEVRAGLTNLQRLQRCLPLLHPDADQIPTVGWHRLVQRIMDNRRLTSLRGGDQRLFALHPPNEFKKHSAALDSVLHAAERGIWAPQQNGQNEWNGDAAGWVEAERNESFVFIICGRDVNPYKINRCLQSLDRQQGRQWGAILMDDGGRSHCSEQLRRWAAERSDRVSYFHRNRPVGGLANLAFAIRHLCGNAQSVIVTLDMDDALLGTQVLQRLEDEYRQGADVTVGTMLRLDKKRDYPVNLDNPRQNRGGNVWQHLRSFKKHLFDAIPDAALRDDDGAYFALAQDWAYMLPIVEMAQKPVHIETPLYLYDPNVSTKKARRAAAEATIARIVRRAPVSTDGAGKP